jgi:hypothetical protein
MPATVRSIEWGTSARYVFHRNKLGKPPLVSAEFTWTLAAAEVAVLTTI